MVVRLLNPMYMLFNATFDAMHRVTSCWRKFARNLSVQLAKINNEASSKKVEQSSTFASFQSQLQRIC